MKKSEILELLHKADKGEVKLADVIGKLETSEKGNFKEIADVKIAGAILKSATAFQAEGIYLVREGKVFYAPLKKEEGVATLYYKGANKDKPKKEKKEKKEKK